MQIAKPIGAMNKGDLHSITAPASEFDAGRLPIGQLLLLRGFINENDLERGLEFQAQFGGRIGAVLVRIGALAESNLLSALSEQLDLPVLTGNDIPTDVANVFETIERSGQPPEWWLDQEALVWENRSEEIVVVVSTILLTVVPVCAPTSVNNTSSAGPGGVPPNQLAEVDHFVSAPAPCHMRPDCKVKRKL